ncbi:fibroblast growth factor-binding protein 3 [Numenius arquata]|uniref:fibroblast growth factor-binding protein 3 n=1 Tax=Numenius arquata TaxID=31919 RepID=UPI003D309A9B
MRLPLALLALAALGVAREAAEAEEEEEAAAGRFTAAGQHRCRWELRWAAGASELRLSCRPAAGGGAARSCAYRGEPRSCPAYGGRSRQFWKQILGRLRRRRPHPCAPGGPLSARLCGPDRAPPEAQLRLLPAPAPSPPAATAEPGAGTYCHRRWHSLCSFFLGFWEG